MNIERLVAATNNAEFTCTDAGCGWALHTVAMPANQAGVCTVPLAAPPCTGKSTDAVKADIVDDAVNFFGPRLDVRAPELTVPANLTVNATSPAGATVTFTATATDNTDASPTVTCTPASGSVFAIATTPVQCTATDDRGNRRRRRSPSPCWAPDRSWRTSSRPSSARARRCARSSPVSISQRPRQRTAACVSLRTFTTLARLLAPTRAAAWIADANRIRAVLAC